MSLSPSKIFGRLQELKQWQQTHEKLLNRSSSREDADITPVRPISSISSLDFNRCSAPAVPSWEVIKHPTAKTFDQLLEEKLTQYDDPAKTEDSYRKVDKPKKPFLKKGTGLVRYRLNLKEYQEYVKATIGLPKKVFNSRANPNENKVESDLNGSKDNQSASKPKQNTLDLQEKNTNPQSPYKNHDYIMPNNEEKCTNQFTPLKAPEVSIKPKGQWCNVSEPVSVMFQTSSPSYNRNGNSDYVITGNKALNSNIIKHINEFTLKMKEENEEPEKKSKSPQRRLDFEEEEILEPDNSDQFLYEKALETELMIFEALERRAELSGFCSTNTSIMQLLASTPSKIQTLSEPSEGKMYSCTDIANINDVRENVCCVESSDFKSAIDTRNASFSEMETCNEETNWEDFVSVANDINLDISGSVASSSEYSSVGVSICPKEQIDNAITSEDSAFKCVSCESLIKNKIDECEEELNNLKIEKNRIVSIREQMAKDKKEFDKEMKMRKKQFEEQRLKFQIEIEEEKKKVAKEKNIFEKYSKDNKLRQHKKDREEMSHLKIELVELKELMKLKDTKYGMSVARLRTQIKNLEKQNGNLKTEVEKLQKEKTKLVAQQKLNRKPYDSKMLETINKNVSKLTQETFKNQHFTMETSSDEDARIFQNNKLGYGAPKLDKPVKKAVERKGEGDDEKEDAKDDGAMTDFKDVSSRNIERQYLNMFSAETWSSKDSKILGRTERVLDDGSKEIKYGNGNVKIILEDGTVRYYYSNNDTWHTNFADGTEVIEFPNGQSETRYKDGKCVVFFSDGLVQTIHKDGQEEIKYPDGSKLVNKKDGEKVLYLSNGQIEIHTKDQKRREYPDGTVKILYPDGSQETRYANGRVRVKNSKGEVIVDTGQEQEV